MAASERMLRMGGLLAAESGGGHRMVYRLGHRSISIPDPEAAIRDVRVHHGEIICGTVSFSESPVRRSNARLTRQAQQGDKRCV